MYYHNNESARVNADKDIAREICAEVGAPWPSEGSTSIRQKKNSLQGQHLHLVAIDQKKVKTMQHHLHTPPHHQQQPQSSATIDPIWRAQILEALRGDGLEPAPADDPDSAAALVTSRSGKEKKKERNT